MFKIVLIVVFVLAIVSGALSYNGDNGKHSIILEVGKFQEGLSDLVSSAVNTVKEFEVFQDSPK